MDARQAAREECAHAVAAVLAGFPVREVRVAGDRDSWCKLSTYVAPTDDDMLIDDLVVRLIGPAVNGFDPWATDRIPPWPGLPLDDLTAAEVVADDYVDTHGSLHSPDALIGAAWERARDLARDEDFLATVEHVAKRTLDASGRATGADVETWMAEHKLRTSAGCRLSSRHRWHDRSARGSAGMVAGAPSSSQQPPGSTVQTPGTPTSRTRATLREKNGVGERGGSEFAPSYSRAHAHARPYRAG